MLRLNEITMRLVESWKADKQATGLANSTINNMLNVLSGCLRYAVDVEVLAALPKIRRLKEASVRREAITVEQADHAWWRTLHEPTALRRTARSGGRTR